MPPLVIASEARQSMPPLVIASEARQSMQFADKPMPAVQGADAVIIVTGFKAYRSPNWVALKAAMKTPVVFVGAICMSRKPCRKAAWTMLPLGAALANELRTRLPSTQDSSQVNL
jgi:hypothetical protein